MQVIVILKLTNLFSQKSDSWYLLISYLSTVIIAWLSSDWFFYCSN